MYSGEWAAPACRGRDPPPHRKKGSMGPVRVCRGLHPKPLAAPPHCVGVARAQVYFDLTVDGQSFGRVVIELFDDGAVGAQRFADLARNVKGIGYRRSKIDAITPSYVRMAGVTTLTYSDAEPSPIAGGKDLAALERAMGARRHDGAGLVSLLVRDEKPREVKEKLVARNGSLQVVRLCPNDKYLSPNNGQLVPMPKRQEATPRTIGIYAQAMGHLCPNDGYMCPNDGYMCPNDRYMCPNDRYMCPNDGYMCPNDRYMCPNDRYMCPNDRYMCPNDRYMCPNDRYLRPTQQVTLRERHMSMPKRSVPLPKRSAAMPKR